MSNWFEDFENHMERKEPGYKARQKTNRIMAELDRAEERAVLIAKAGSLKKALADNPAEAAINRSVAKFQKHVRKKYANGTFEVFSLDGWTNEMEQPSERVLHAVRNAIDLPTTISAAAIEHECWVKRDRERQLLTNTLGDTALSLGCALRRDLIYKLLRYELRAASLDDVIVRQRLTIEEDGDDVRLAWAILADLQALKDARP